MAGQVRRMLLIIALAAATAPLAALAQAVSRPDPEAAARALTQEVLGIFETVCVAATLRGEAVPAVVARVLGASAATVPPDRLRSTDAVRETAGWIVAGRQGRYRLNTIEPGGQCGLLAEGVDHDAFLSGAERIMAQADATMPGWAATGAPRRNSGARPFGTLTYVSGSFTRAAAPPRVLTITGSAAARTDGRPNTGVISIALRDPAR